MGLIMLILVGTVPTAYALNHTVTPAQVQTFAAVSTQVAGSAGQLCQTRGTVMQDAGPELEKFVSTKTYEPGVMLALQQMVSTSATRRRVRLAEGVPQEMQANVRNQMYLTSETLRLLAKSGGPKMPPTIPRSLPTTRGSWISRRSSFRPG
jgi:PiT family inorganic phosphate transporter